MAKLKLASLFAGICSINLWFELAGVEPIWVNEIYGFRFVMQAPATGSSNSGRLSIGNILI